MARVPRRLWDSCVIIGYLAGAKKDLEDCEDIIAQAEAGELEIVVSAMATIEVAFLKGYADPDAELRISELFGRDYIVIAAIDGQLAKISRALIRKYQHDIQLRLKPADATHLATAVQWGIPVIETTDPDLLKLDGREGSPPIDIRKPLYDGPPNLPGF